MADALWDHRKVEHLDVFNTLLRPLVAASRTRDFAQPEQAKNQLIAWVMSLKDVPLPLLEAGVERLMAGGVGWMPRPDVLRAACCDIRDEQRRIAIRQARALAGFCDLCGEDHCPDCHGSGLRDVDAPGVLRNTVTPCLCKQRELAAMAQVEAPLARPALPAYEGTDQ